MVGHGGKSANQLEVPVTLVAPEASCFYTEARIQNPRL